MTYSAYKQLPIAIRYASVHKLAPSSRNAEWRIQDGVASVEHDAVDCKVVKNSTLYSLCSAKLMPKNSTGVCGKPAVELMADRHCAQCVSWRHRVTPLHVESKRSDVVVVVVVDVDVGETSPQWASSTTNSTIMPSSNRDALANLPLRDATSTHSFHADNDMAPLTVRVLTGDQV